MPQIILKSGSNIAAIKRYFTSKIALIDISDAMGIDYNRIKTGQVKLVVEPMAYFCYDGGYYAMTATEAALFDKAVGGKLKYNMRPFSHNNLPLSLFLESSDLGIPAYTGSTTLLCSASDSYAAVDDLIISQLGVGIVYGVGGVVTPAGDVTVSDYEFRADTDVIIPVTFKNNGGDIVPSSNAYITYTCSLGTTYNVQLVCPSGESQLVWLKWHTPKAAQTVTFAVSSAAVSMSPKTITCKIVKYDEATPPDPQYEDKARKINNTAEREFGNRTSASWSEWYYNTASGSFALAAYTARLNVSFNLIPDENCPTAYYSNNRYVMKSGYGFQAKCDVSVVGSSGVSTYDLTPTQNNWAYFNEWDYKTYCRFLVRDKAALNCSWRFKNNKFSYNKSPIHFTPLWFPDDTNYTTELIVFDAWTPAGQLYATVSDSIYIYGNCLNDWVISRNK